jgi:hypothetical protein
MRDVTRLLFAASALTVVLSSCSSADRSSDGSHVPVPDVVGMNLRDAIGAFDASGYCVGTVWRVDGGEPGVVIGQQPGPQNDTVGPGYLIGLEVVASPQLQDALSQTEVADCDPELAPAGTVNHANFYTGTGTN